MQLFGEEIKWIGGLMSEKRCILLDVSAFAHAAWHAYRPSLGVDGSCYRVVHGVLNKLHQLERVLVWDHIVAVLDPEDGSLFRKSLYPQYKANRPEQDVDFIRQKRLLRSVLEASGIFCLQIPGVESDDVIGSLSHQARQSGALSVIVSPDKDLMQLANERVAIFKPLKKVPLGGAHFEYISHMHVKEITGIEPMQIPDWLALIGDTSDNIPGVKGIGKVGATKILQKFGSLEYLLMNLDQLDEKTRIKVEPLKDLLPKIKQLTTVQLNIPVPQVEDWKISADPVRFEHFKNQMLFPDYLGNWMSELKD